MPVFIVVVSNRKPGTPESDHFDVRDLVVHGLALSVRKTDKFLILHNYTANRCGRWIAPP